ncbi:hypothetical protein H6G97_29985 [Nostoc flagelliforme FACHB-838]|uniref:Uncharacterized protein n=1 Tax=Nostoc flagelliforme FACHB-838 TaxID=2692904 RepID=A0ABR8DYV8_9NOSO|nr:hypothetical protein [Nostoc flagelliforme]MBD2533563.1 hypothetical protein [Nostoc flagelliforme FACHB-838]
MLAFIGWQHEHEHQQLVEVQRSLNQRGVEINESNVGKLYRQFLALLGGTIAHTQAKLAATAVEHGGLIWAIDALQPEGHGTLLYVLYEVLSGTPVSGIQLPQAQTQRLIEWLQPYQKLPLHCAGNFVRWGKINHFGNEFKLARCTTTTLSGTLFQQSK